MGAGVATGQSLQLPAEFGPVHWPDPTMGSSSRAA
jgi:hypothetical protein